jgi:hypothetical protein
MGVFVLWQVFFGKILQKQPRLANFKIQVYGHHDDRNYRFGSGPDVEP